jgi:hypothetical protein
MPQGKQWSWQVCTQRWALRMAGLFAGPGIAKGVQCAGDHSAQEISVHTAQDKQKHVGWLWTS